MAAPAPRRVSVEAPGPDAPPTDPSDLQRALRRERARRNASLEHEQELKRARLRFFALLLTLLFVAALISLAIWDTLQALFGI
jgi:hypothetical protein